MPPAGMESRNSAPNRATGVGSAQLLFAAMERAVFTVRVIELKAHTMRWFHSYDTGTTGNALVVHALRDLHLYVHAQIRHTNNSSSGARMALPSTSSVIGQVMRSTSCTPSIASRPMDSTHQYCCVPPLMLQMVNHTSTSTSCRVQI